MLRRFLKLLLIVLIAGVGFAQVGDPPNFTDDLLQDGPARGGVTSCDDVPLRTDIDKSPSQATCDTCPGGKSPTEISETYEDTGDPILLHNGAVSFRATDLHIPGRGIDFNLTRRYNSKRSNEDSVMGYGWEFAFDQRIDFDGDPTANARVTGRLQNGNNRIDNYTKLLGQTAFVGNAGLYTRLSQYSATEWILRARHGSRSYYEYAPIPGRNFSYRLRKIEDASGNSLTLSYYPAGALPDYLPGRLEKITDSLGRDITFNYIQTLFQDVRLEKVTDFTGREVVYGYDDIGNLLSARSPVVNSTGDVNDFPNGRTEQYTYHSGTSRLYKIIRPREVAPGTPNPAAYVAFAYYPAGDWRDGWVQSQNLGGYSIAYSYSTTTAPPYDVGPVSILTSVTDRRGNLTQYWFNPTGQVALKRELVSLPGGATANYDTKFTYNSEGEVLTVTRPRGNIETRTYHTPTTRFQTGNLASVIHSRGTAADVHPNYDSITVEYTWEPVFNNLLTRTDPRNAAWKTEFVVDYMEGHVEPPGGANDVAPGIASMLGIGVESARALVSNLVRNADLNGDSIGGSSGTVLTRGLVIQRIEPPVNLDQSIGIDHQSAAEGDASQQAITSWTYNIYGQVTSETDSEENITLFGYTRHDDVNNDGVKDDGGGSPVGQTGGMPLRTIEDTSLPYSGDFVFPGQFSGLVVRALPTDIGRNVGLTPAPAPANRVTDLSFNLRRQVIAYVDGRGVRHEMSVNELGEVWEVRKGMDTTAASTRQGGAPEEANEAHLSGGAFNYKRVILRDANAMVVSVQDTDSVAGGSAVWETQYVYNILDNLITERQEKAHGTFVTTQIIYDANENVEKVVSQLGNFTGYTYDSRDQQRQTYLGSPGANPGDLVEELTYDGNGNTLSRVNGRGYTTQYGYDEFDRVRIITDALGNESITTYDQASNVTQVLEKMKPTGSGAAADLRSTLTSYDERRRPWRFDRKAEDGTSLTEGAIFSGDSFITNRIDYDRLSRRTFRTEDDNQSYERHYDGLGRLTWTKDPAGNIRQRSFDDENNVVLITETDTYPSGTTRAFWTWRRYDALGRLVSFTNMLGETDRYSYDARDFVTGSSDAEAPGSGGTIHGVTVNPPGNTQSYTYDGRGLLLSETQDLRVNGIGSGAITDTIIVQKVWDDDGRLWKQIDDNGNVTEYVLDHRGRAYQEKFADGTEIQRVFDGNDNVDWKIDARGNNTDLQYDVLDRLQNVILETNPATALGTTRASFTYDGLGRRTGTTGTYRTQADANAPGLDHQWVTTRTWDVLDRLLSETQNGKLTTYSWREEAKRMQVVYPTAPALTVDYIYDSLDRVSKVKTGGTDLASYKYAGTDRKLDRSLRNRSVTRWHDGTFADTLFYDGAKRQKRLDHFNILTSVQLASFEHEYTRTGARKLERRIHDASKGDNYGLDSLYRLTKFERRVPAAHVGTLGLGQDEFDRSWTLDGAHNWTGFTIDAASYTSAVDQVHNYDIVPGFGGVVSGYDLDGNLTSPNTAGPVVLDYDFLNRLVRIRNTSEGSAVEHVYDAEGRRVRTIFQGVANTPIERQYVYDGWEVIEEHDLVAGAPPTWKFMRRYVMGIDIDEPICVEALPGQAGTRTLYFMQSTLGNVVGLTNSGGAVVERYTYDAYGQPRFENASNAPLANQQSAYGNLYLFSGRRYEPWILPLYEFRNRFYLPEQGRFIQRDPIGIWEDSGNLGSPVAYAWGRPFDARDPFGLTTDVHDILDVGGLIPVAGPFVDGFHALWYACEGDWSNALATGFSAVPVFGDAAAVARMGAKAGKAAKAAKNAEKIAKKAKEHKEHVEKLDTAKKDLAKLEKQLADTKGPKAQEPIKEQIKKLAESIKGHEKEIGQIANAIENLGGEPPAPPGN